MRFVFKSIGWLLGLALLALAIVFGINQTDEPLSAEAEALLKMRKPPELGERNGYPDLLALRELAPNGQRIAQCSADHFGCIASPAGKAEFEALVAKHAEFLQRYRALQTKPNFIDTSVADAPDSAVPAYADQIGGMRLVLIGAALRFQAGDQASALRELEAEVAFQRRAAEQARTLIQKMIGVAVLDELAIYAAELARRIPAANTLLHGRLAAIVPEPTKAQLDVVPALDLERANIVEWMRTRKYARVPDAVYEMFKQFGEERKRPWWDPIAPWFYRPHYSVNLYVAISGIANSVAKVPSTEFLGSVNTYWERAWALDPKGWRRWLLSPVSHDHYFLQVPRTTDYIARMYGHAGVQMLVRLQLRLRAAGTQKPDDVAAALADPKSGYRDPFTGKPFDFDTNTMTIGFPCEAKYLSGTGRKLRNAAGRVSLPL